MNLSRRTRSEVSQRDHADRFIFLDDTEDRRRSPHEIRQIDLGIPSHPLIAFPGQLLRASQITRLPGLVRASDQGLRVLPPLEPAQGLDRFERYRRIAILLGEVEQGFSYVFGQLTRFGMANPRLNAGF